MLHPSYSELIDHVNHTNKELGLPDIKSRYTLVMAVAKRARRLVEGAPLMVEDTVNGRMLSQAVNEMEAEKLGIEIEPAEDEDEPVYNTYSGGFTDLSDSDVRALDEETEPSGADDSVPEDTEETEESASEED